MAVTTDTIRHLERGVREAGKRYCLESLEAAEPLLILGAAHYIVEDYGKAEGMFVRYSEIVKTKLGPNTLEAFHGLGTLAEIYFFLHRFQDACDLNNEAKSISKKIDPCADDPMLEALFRGTDAYKGKTDLKSHQRGFVMALMALSLCITRGWHRGSGGAQIVDGLRVFFDSYGIHGDEWQWTVRHAHLTRHDFVGLLSILLHHTGLAPSPLVPLAKQSLSVVEVR
jgi:hypothetical protein